MALFDNRIHEAYDSSMSHSVTNEQIDYVFKQLKISGWPHAFAVLITAMAIWNYEKSYLISVWFFCAQLAHFCRVIFVDRMWECRRVQQ